MSEEACNATESKVAVDVLLERDEIVKTSETDTLASLEAHCADLEITLKRSNKTVAEAKIESTRLQRLIGQLKEVIEVLEGNQIATDPVAHKVLSRLQC